MRSSGAFLLSSPERARICLILFFNDIRSLHNERTHHQVLDALAWPETKAIFCLACKAEGASGGDWDTFETEVRRQAELARQSGLVRPNGVKRAPGGGRKPREVGNG